MANLDNAAASAAIAAVFDDLANGVVTEAEASSSLLAIFNAWYTLPTAYAEQIAGFLLSIGGFIVTDGAPSDAVGADGEFALDSTSGELYGPKTGGEWGPSILSLGGEDGADGRTILSGTGAPGSGVGEDGDFYYDTDASDFYGPKASGAWPAGVSLIGPQGDAVELQKSATHIQWRYEGEETWADLVALADLRGEDGTEIELQATATHIQWRLVGGTWADLIALSALKGDAGDEVSLQTTATHIQWRLGAGAWQDLIALSALKGDEGASAYEVAVSNGFVGTEAEWLASLLGDQGLSAYEVAVDEGFTGTASEWLQSLIGPQGKLADDFKGAWDGGTAYAADDIVTYQGETWLALQGSTGTTPTEGATWTKLAAKGADGEGAGTVTSVAISGSDGIEIDSGSPITSSGTIALGVNAAALRTHINVEGGADVTDATNVAAAGAVMDSDFSANGFMKRTGAGAYSSVSEIPLADLEQDGATDGQVLTWNNAAGAYEPQDATGGGGGVTVAAIQTSAFTPEVGNAYPVDASGGSITLTALPSSPSQGDRFELHDPNRSWGASTSVTIPGADGINGRRKNQILTLTGARVIFEYVDSEYGWEMKVIEPKAADAYTAPLIEAPTITGPSDAATDIVPGQTAFTVSAYSAINHAEAQVSTEYQYSTASDFGTIAHSETETDTPNSYTPPNDDFTTSTQYYMRARQKSATYTSDWSNVISFTTAAVYATPMAATGGDSVYESGDWMVHVFDTLDDFVVTAQADGIAPEMEALIVAAGASSGERATGGAAYTGGGGAGEMIEWDLGSLANGTYPVVVGAATTTNTGGDSSFNGNTANGGGRGGRVFFSGDGQGAAADSGGGSGGGGGYHGDTPATRGDGRAASPSGTSGTSYTSAGEDASGVAPNYSGRGGGAGGLATGRSNSITGTAVTYAAGGDTAAATNPGDGGPRKTEGTGYNPGANGRVVIRYKIR